MDDAEVLSVHVVNKLFRLSILNAFQAHTSQISADTDEMFVHRSDFLKRDTEYKVSAFICAKIGSLKHSPN